MCDWLDRARGRVDQYPLRWSCAFVFFPLLAVYLATATYDGLQSPDPLAAAIPAWQLATHGTLDLDAFEGLLPWFVQGQDHVVSDRMPGIIFFGVPFYWLLPTSASGLTLGPAAVAAATASAGAVTVLHGLLRRLVPTSTALAAALVAGLATATWTVSADGLWPHGPNQLWLATTLVFLAAGGWSVSGLCLGLAVVTRPHTAFVAAVAGLYASWRRRSLKPAILIGVVSLAGVVVVVAYHNLMFGEPSLLGGYAQREAALLPPSGLFEYAQGLAGTLVSPDRGVLVLSPFLVLLLPGLRRAWRVAPDWVRAGALSGVVYMLVQLALNRFSGGHNFYSYRLPLEMLTLSAPLLVLAWREWTAQTAPRRRAFDVLVCVSLLTHTLGALYWTPTFDERSPWTNLKALEAATSAGMLLVVWMVVAVCLAVFLVLRTGRRALPGDTRAIPIAAPVERTATSDRRRDGGGP